VFEELDLGSEVATPGDEDEGSNWLGRDTHVRIRRPGPALGRRGGRASLPPREGR
jgi:hypothetical protein